MSGARAFVAVALAFSAALAIASAVRPQAAAPARRRVYAATFPDGAGRAIAERSCVACHAPTLVTQQAKDSAAWARTIGQMQKWGVVLAPGEADSLRDYLVARLGPRRAAPR